MRTKQLLSMMLVFLASFVFAQNDNCNGTLTDNVEIDGGEPFELGYTYNFFTVGDEVTATFTLLDTVVGLVGFYQTLNPDFVEVGPVFPDPGTQTVSETFSGFAPGETFSMRIKFNYAGGFSTGDTLTYTVGDNCGFTPPEALELPVTFENPNVDYTFENFAGGVSTVIPNPDASGINTSSTVAEMVKNAGEVFGGSVIPLDDPIDFSENKLFQMKVWSPRVGARVLLKVENALNPGIFFEVEDTSTVANEWETLSFDYNAINAANEYSRIVLIWDLGVVGDGSPNFTFYYDDIELVMGGMEPAQIDLPITFEDNMLDYGLTDFGGAVSSIVPDPEDAANTVVQTIRTAGSQVFAGTTVGQPLGLENPVPFDFDNTGMSARVWSPEAGVVVKLKVEQVGNPGIFVEQDVVTTTSNEWETLEFDFSTPVAGGLNLDLDYNLVTIFFNFGADPGTTPEQTYFFDDIDFAPGVGGFVPVTLPIDFDTPDVTFGLFDFGGNVSTKVADPEDPSNTVAQSIRTANAATFAGTTVPQGGLTDRIPFAPGETTMSVRVWSPEVGVPVRMKLEATDLPGLVAEKEIATTTSGEWETMVFDFSVDALVPVDVNADFDIVTLFFNFGLENGPEQTYFWDDVAFGTPTVPCENPYPQVDGLSFSNVSGGVALSWNPIPGSIGCQLQVGTSFQDVQTVTVFGENASSFFVPGNFVNVGQTYSWRVRCGCSTNPFVVGPYSAISQFTYLGLGLTTETETTLSAFPNPSDGNAFISLSTDVETEQGIIEVYDLSGRLVKNVYSGSVAANQEVRFEFNGSNLPEGIYVIRYTTSETTISEKMIISK